MKIAPSFTNIFTLLFVGVSLFLSSCKGPAGPIGPAGSQGSAGAAGASGATGAAGQNGNANVIQVSYGAKTWATAKISLQQFILPNITPAVMNSSAVLVYMTDATPSNTTGYPWFSIPGTVYTNTEEHKFFFETTFAASTSGINIYRETASKASLTASTRIIIIPANDLRNGRKANVDFNDYNAVKAYYNLKD